MKQHSQSYILLELDEWKLLGNRWRSASNLVCKYANYPVIRDDNCGDFRYD